MAEGQVLEEVDVHLFGVLARTREPQTNRHLGMTEEELRIGDGQTEIDRQQDLGHLCHRRAQTIEGGAQATRKALAARLALPRVNAIHTSLAIPDQGVEGRIGVAAIITVWVGARMAHCANGLAPTAPTFAFTPREYTRLARVAPQRSGMRPSTHQAIVWRARLEGTWRLACG
jgi:hypothetical protein